MSKTKCIFRYLGSNYATHLQISDQIIDKKSIYPSTLRIAVVWVVGLVLSLMHYQMGRLSRTPSSNSAGGCRTCKRRYTHCRTVGAHKHTPWLWWRRNTYSTTTLAYMGSSLLLGWCCVRLALYIYACMHNMRQRAESWLGSIIIAGALPTWLALYTHMRHTNIHVFASAHPNTNTHTQPTSSSAQGKKPLGDDTSPATNQPRYMYNNIAPVCVYHHRHVAQ